MMKHIFCGVFLLLLASMPLLAQNQGRGLRGGRNSQQRQKKDRNPADAVRADDPKVQQGARVNVNEDSDVRIDGGDAAAAAGLNTADTVDAMDNAAAADTAVIADTVVTADTANTARKVADGADDGMEAAANPEIVAAGGKGALPNVVDSEGKQLPGALGDEGFKKFKDGLGQQDKIRGGAGAGSLTDDDLERLKELKRNNHRDEPARRRSFDPEKLRELKRRASERKQQVVDTPKETPEEKHEFVMESMLTFPLNAKSSLDFYELAQSTSSEFTIAYYSRAPLGFALDVTVFHPDGTIAYRQNRMQEGKFKVRANQAGEYKIVIKNPKNIDIVVSFGLESNDGIDVLKKIAEKESNYDDETLDPSDYMLNRINDRLQDIMREQRYLRSREAEHRMTQESTNSRVAYYSLVESVVFILAAVFQNIWVQNLVTPKRVV